jgi:outer membrane receptor protein involved in Fe transport
VIYKLRDDDKNPFNIRLNYSKTLARPSLREYSESIVYDNELRADVFGNANLKLVKVNNYDVRMETYFPGGDFVSLSLFYKDFKNHIELIDLNGGFSWSNSDFSTVKGIEIDGRKKLGKNIEFTTNISLISSKSTVIGYALMLDVPTKVQTWFPIDTFERVMFGQAPYVINTMLAYNYEKIGLNISLAYNLQGPRLTIQGARNVSDLSKNVPDIFEMPRHLFDLKIIQRLTERFGISLTVRDILNSPIRRSYKFTDSGGNNLGYLVDFDSFQIRHKFFVKFFPIRF